MGIITKSQQITTLQRPTWLDAAGFSKGVDHDRQHLGIILDVEQVIKVRQTNSAFKDQLNLRLLHDHNVTEVSVSFGSDWVEVSAKAETVPFIGTPYTRNPHSDVIPTVEFEYSDKTKTLPVYRKGENESEFYALWDRTKAGFALIDVKYVNILVPSISKAYLIKTRAVDGIDGLIDYYEYLFSFYNMLAGVSFEPERPTDLNIGNRYFLKANKGGSGGDLAYGGDMTIEGDPTANAWLTTDVTDPNNWANLHEIGHGYQVRFAEKYFATGEVWNNIYAASFQRTMLDDNTYKARAWLYNYGDQEGIEKGISDLIKTGKAVNEWDLRSKLHFMMMMVEKAGLNAFTHFNQQYRLKSNSSDFVREDHDVLDELSGGFAVAGNQVDVTPFLQLVKGYITPSQRDYNSFSHAKAVYPLNQLVQEPKLTELQQELHLITPFNLVDVQQLRFCGIKSDVKLRLNIDDFSQIAGENLVLWDGGREAAALPINSQDLALGKLPIGVYTMRLPTGKDKKYDIQSNYLVVKQDDHNQQQVDFVPKLGSPLMAQKIEFTGLGEGVVASVSVDHVKHMVTIDIISTDVDPYYPKDRYIELTVWDKDKTEKKFNKTMYGINNTKGHDEVPFSYGDKIEIFYLGATSHLQLIPPAEGMLVNSLKATHNLEITPSGLKNEILGKDSQDSLLPRLEKAATTVRGDPVILNASFAGPKDDIYLAINAFTSTQREKLLEQYADCISTNNAAPSDKFTVQSSRNLVQLQKDLQPHEQDISAMSQANSSNISPAATTQILDVLGVAQGIDMTPAMEL